MKSILWELDSLGVGGAVGIPGDHADADSVTGRKKVKTGVTLTPIGVILRVIRRSPPQLPFKTYLRSWSSGEMSAGYPAQLISGRLRPDTIHRYAKKPLSTPSPTWIYLINDVLACSSVGEVKGIQQLHRFL